MTTMIEIEGLTKRYGNSGISNVSFSCKPGTVTGFLGPNGAGKSTTMKVLCGLTRQDSGKATIGGHTYGSLTDPGRQVGALLDPSAHHAGRTGRETLRLSARILDVPDERVEQLLEAVELGAHAGRRVGKYSLGMRQRLALANALLGDPGVLVLDEPANGLDPEGIRWMRSLLREFVDRGGTVLLSSHLLSEVQAVADRLVIIGAGQIKADGTTDELLGGSSTVVRSLDADALASQLDATGFAWKRDANGSLRVKATPEDLGRAAHRAGVVLVELRAGDGGLEELFFSLTSDQAEEAKV